MRSGKLVVLDYGMGNIHSILKALRLYHEDVEFTSDPEKIKSCSALVLPGDGAFAAAMDGLKATSDLIREHVILQRPLLGVCIGFQVLFNDSSESLHSQTSGDLDGPLIQGLGLIPGKIRKFQFESPSTRVPHMGWNRIHARASPERQYMHEYMYFIHSYRAVSVSQDVVVATCDYNEDIFPAIVQCGSMMACQFHPEKSGKHGLHLLEDWVRNS